MTSFHEDREAARRAAEKLKIFAQPLRLMILSCLLRGERNVGEIAEATGIGQPALSQQLAELRRADFVRTRRQAKQICYALADPGIERCVIHLETLLDEEEKDAPPPIVPVSSPDPRLPPPCGVAGFARVIEARTRD